MAVAGKAEKHVPSISDLKRAHAVFLEREARDLFYVVATDLVDRALLGKGPVGLAAAVAVLLATWNRRFYQRGRRCDRKHVDAISQQLRRDGHRLLAFRGRRIETLNEDDLVVIDKLFRRFEPLLGRVGAAKCFHLLAPNFFPLWDNTIAAAYHMPLSGWQNSQRYARFMGVVRAELEHLGGGSLITKAVDVAPLKALDEYNYCVAQGWLSRT